MLHDRRDGALIIAMERPLVALYEDEIGADLAELMAADAPGCSAVVLDLSRVREIDSRGVSLVIDLHRRCRHAGFAFCVVGVTEHVRRVLDLFQLGTLFPVESEAAPAPHA
jgi:anti-anti-sigma factor